jgi:N-acetyl-gamma-glutamyl-phosphate reductase
VFATAYGFEHPHPQWLGSFVYGLPELGGPLAAARRVTVPGCFATAIVLSLAPIWRALDEAPVRVRVVGVTGSTGSGATPSARTHHPVRATNLAPYRPLVHQHAPEIEHVLASLRAEESGEMSPVTVDFVPVSAPLSRGISTTTFVDLPEDLPEGSVDAWFAAAYEDRPFIRRFGSDGRVAEVAAVKGSMFVELSWAQSRCGRTLAITAALDNLAKGGAGQAVQCMNVLWERPEARGLGGPALWP